MTLSEAGHLVLPLRDGDRVGWGILDVMDPGAKPIPVALPRQGGSNLLLALWGPSERLAIVMSAYSDGQAWRSSTRRPVRQRSTPCRLNSTAASQMAAASGRPTAPVSSCMGTAHYRVW